MVQKQRPEHRNGEGKNGINNNTMFKLQEVQPEDPLTWFAPKDVADIDLTYNDIAYHAFFHLKGGLGDIIRHLFASGVGRYLHEMPQNQKALIFLHSHTSPESLQEIAELFDRRHSFYAIPWVNDLYETHPNLQNLEIYDLVFTNRMKYMFQTVFHNHFNRRYDLFSYAKLSIHQPYVVLQRCAGTRGRDIPMSIIICIVKYLNARGIQVKHIGKHYKRGFVPHWSPPMFSEEKEDLWDIPIPLQQDNNSYEYLVDNTDIQETRRLVANAQGVITPFSSMSLLAMEFNRPLLCMCTIHEKSTSHNYVTHFSDNKDYAFWGGIEYTRAPKINRYCFLDHENVPMTYEPLASNVESPPAVPYPTPCLPETAKTFDTWCDEAFKHFL